MKAERKLGIRAAHNYICNISEQVLLVSHNRNRHSGLTCFCEPGGGRVGVDGAKPDHLVEFGALTDRHADQRVGLLRDHQHLKDLQRTWQREVDVLLSRSGDSR